MALAQDKRTSAENQVSRRNLLNAAVAAIPVATVAAIGSAFVAGDVNAAAFGVLLAGEPETPVARLYREWRAFCAWTDSDDWKPETEAEEEVINDRMMEMQEALYTEKATGPMDVMIKYLAFTEISNDWGGCDWCEIIDAEARALIAA